MTMHDFYFVLAAEAEQLPDGAGKTNVGDLPPGADEGDSTAPLDALDFDDGWYFLLVHCAIS